MEVIVAERSVTLGALTSRNALCKYREALRDDEALFSLSCCPLLKVNPMEVIVAERSVTLGAFTLPRVVSGLQTIKTEYVKTLGQDGVFLASVTTRTSQLCLKNKNAGNIRPL